MSQDLYRHDGPCRAQSSTPAQLGQLLDREITRWSEVIHKAGIAQQ
jgi:tripartite-type tricarboxylate transporter receptor subunit TctC